MLCLFFFSSFFSVFGFCLLLLAPWCFRFAFVFFAFGVWVALCCCLPLSVLAGRVGLSTKFFVTTSFPAPPSLLPFRSTAPATQLIMKLGALVLGAAVGLATAHPTSKVCTTQTGSDSNGVPTVDGDFTAMGATWDKVTTASDTIFQVSNGKLSLNVDDSNYGLFAIVENGNLTVASGSSYTSTCNNGCGRLICIVGLDDGVVPLEISNSDSSTCASTSLVVGYATGKTSGNTLQFASVNACDSASITVSAVGGDSSAASSTTVSAVLASVAAVAAVVAM